MKKLIKILIWMNVAVWASVVIVEFFIILLMAGQVGQAGAADKSPVAKHRDSEIIMKHPVWTETIRKIHCPSYPEREYKLEFKQIIYDDIIVNYIPFGSGTSACGRHEIPEQTIDESVNKALKDNPGWEFSHFRQSGIMSIGYGEMTHIIWLKKRVWWWETVIKSGTSPHQWPPPFPWWYNVR